MKKSIFLLAPVLIGLTSLAQVPVKTEGTLGHYQVVIDPSTRYTTVVWTTHGTGIAFSEPCKSGIQLPVVIQVSDLVSLWLLGPNDTTSVMIAVPLTDDEHIVMRVDGYYPGDNSRWPKELWSYDYVMPIIKGENDGY